jgi:hypothetical protein
MTEMLWGHLEGRTFHRIRGEVLEQAVRMEHLMGSAISAAYGQNASTAAEIQAEFLARMPIGQQISTLRRILDDRDLTPDYAFVVPVLTKTFELRNDLAHSISTGYDTEARTINLVSMRKGKEVPKSYEALYVHWLVRDQAPVVESELRELYWLIAPQDEAWHES